MPTIRTQVDGLNELYSLQTGLDCSTKPDMVRQEFKDETDVNNILARYGVNGMTRDPIYTEVDYNADLQQSLEAIREAQRAIEKLPPELRSKYGTWGGLLNGAASGAFRTDLAAYYAAKKAAEEASALAKAAPVA